MVVRTLSQHLTAHVFAIIGLLIQPDGLDLKRRVLKPIAVSLSCGVRPKHCSIRRHSVSVCEEFAHPAADLGLGPAKVGFNLYRCECSDLEWPPLGEVMIEQPSPEIDEFGSSFR